MMQAPESAKRSPWAMRLAIAGSVMVLLGIIMVSSQSETISETIDPREQYQGAYTGDGTFTTGALDDECYRFYQVAGEPEMSISLFKVEGSAISGDALDEKQCMLDWQAMTADGTELVLRASWVLNTSGEHAVVIECEENCDETMGWLISVDALQEGLFSSPALVFGVSICCLGIFTTPIAAIIYFASKPSKTPKVMMVGEDGRLIPITDLNPEHPTFFQQVAQNEPANGVAPPFSDTVEKQQSDTIVDGTSEVSAGTMLTTEQVYALMRGDVEGAQDHARVAGAPRPTPEDAVQEAANAAAIASWDEGVPLAQPKPVASKRSNAHRQQQPSSSDTNVNAWKDWDEQ